MPHLHTTSARHIAPRFAAALRQSGARLAFARLAYTARGVATWAQPCGRNHTDVLATPADSQRYGNAQRMASGPECSVTVALPARQFAERFVQTSCDYSTRPEHEFRTGPSV